jgi:hypothetical protein
MKRYYRSTKLRASVQAFASREGRSADVCKLLCRRLERERRRRRARSGEAQKKKKKKAKRNYRKK